MPMIDELPPPGRIRDALVAEHVMGWTRIDLNKRWADGAPMGPWHDIWSFPNGERAPSPSCIPTYSTDLDRCWLVVEHITNPTTALVHPPSGFPAGTHFAHWFKRADLWAMSRAEAADAITRAALVAVGALARTPDPPDA